MKKYFLLFFCLMFLHDEISVAQCSGGNNAGTIIPSMTQQNIAINGNSYYTFYAIGGDHYFFYTPGNLYDCEITILDSAGNYAGAYHRTGNGFYLRWKPAASGTYRALINLHPCLASSATAGNMNYVWAPYHPFPTDSAQWSIRHTHNNPFSQDSWQLKMKGDTLLDGITYHKIFYSLDLSYSSPNETLHCFIREDTARKIFVKYPVGSGVDTSEFVIYDFNTNYLDTITTRLLYYTTDSIITIFAGLGDFGTTIIDTRCIYQQGVMPFPLWGGNCDIMQWTEGIGSFTGLLYNEIPQNGCMNDNYEISCFWERGIYIMGGTFCDYNTGLNEPERDSDSFYIYPNPVSDISTIDLRGRKVERIEIFNVLGNQVAKDKVGDIHQILISKKDYNIGIYICKLFYKDEKYFTVKFIVQ